MPSKATYYIEEMAFVQQQKQQYQWNIMVKMKINASDKYVIYGQKQWQQQQQQKERTKKKQSILPSFHI